MKKSCLLVLILTCSLGGFAQVRHVKGIKSVEAGGGISGYGTMFYGGYVTYFSSKWNAKFNVFYENGKHVSLKYTSIGGDISAAYSPFVVGEWLYINLRGGVTAASDRLNPPITVYDKDGVGRDEDFSTLKFGAFGGIETESFINNDFVFILGGNQRYMFNKKEWGNTRYYLYAGIRYNL